jgi:hypothetical protein
MHNNNIKVVIFSKRKYRPEVKLKLDGIELDYTDAYLYLGVLFHYTESAISNDDTPAISKYDSESFRKLIVLYKY